MTINAINKILRVSNACLLFSLCMWIPMSFIDVVPSKQSSFERMLYSVAMVFIISLGISIFTVIVRKISSAKCLSRFAKPQIMFCAIIAAATVFASPIAMLIYKDCFKGQPIIPFTVLALCKMPYALLLLCVAITTSDLRGYKFWRAFSYSLFLLVCFIFLLGIILPIFSHSTGFH